MHFMLLISHNNFRTFWTTIKGATSWITLVKKNCLMNVFRFVVRNLLFKNLLRNHPVYLRFIIARNSIWTNTETWHLHVWKYRSIYERTEICWCVVRTFPDYSNLWKWLETSHHITYGNSSVNIEMTFKFSKILKKCSLLVFP